MGKRFLVLSLCYLMAGGPETLFAANSQWTQSDWSGGATTATTGHDPLQNGQSQWNKYNVKDPNVDTSSQGQVSLSSILNAWTDTNFNSGRRTNLALDGSGFLTLILPYTIYTGTGADGNVTVNGGTTTIDGTKNYNNLTIQNGGTLTVSPATPLSVPSGIGVSKVSTPSGTNLDGLYYYVVTAVDRFGVETPRGPSSDGGGNGERTSVLSTLSISWTGDPGAVGYRVYRRRSSGSQDQFGDYLSPSLIKVITLPDAACTAIKCSFLDTVNTPSLGAPHLKTVPSAPADSVPNTSGGAVPDGTYDYVVTAIDFLGFETTPGTQREVTVSGGGGKSSVPLSWNALGEAAGYRVYRTTTSGIYNNPSLVCDTSTTSCIDTQATPLPGAPPQSYDNAFANGGVQINVQGTLSVDATSSIVVDGKGFPGGVGSATPGNGAPGKGPGAGGTLGGGGGYGSPGTSNSSPDPSQVGTTYGDVLLNPSYLGSGGSAGSSGSYTGAGKKSGDGGAGGGALRISANAVSLSGTLSAKGRDGVSVNQTDTSAGGGGSGGSILIEANNLTWTASGRINARGGNGGTSTGSLNDYTKAGDGGDGRIRISAGNVTDGSGLTAIATPIPFVGNMGVYESAVQDLGAGGVKFFSHSLSWTATPCDGCNLKFLLATNKDNRTWVFRGPNGGMEGSSTTDYYTVPGTQIWSGHDGNRYVKYKVIFESAAIASSPILKNVSIGYEFNPSLQVLTSSPYDTTNTSNSMRRIQWDELRPEGTRVGFQLRTATNPSALASLADWHGSFHTGLLTSGVPVVDPGFESCTTDSGTHPQVPPSGAWTLTSASGTLNNSAGCITKTTSPKSWALRDGGTQSPYFYQTITLNAAVAYTFSVSARVPLSPTGGQATLLISSAPGGGTPYCSKFTNSSSYIKLECTPSIPFSNTTTVYINLMGNSSANAFFDDVAVSITTGTIGLDTLSVTDAGGFQVGDSVTITDANNRNQWELRRIKSIDRVHQTVTVDSPLVNNYVLGSTLANLFIDPLGTQPIDPSNRDGVNDQWLQYRVFLMADSRLQAPVLLEDKIGYFSASGIYQPDGVIDENGNGVYGAAGSGAGGTSGSQNVDPGFVGGQGLYSLQIQNDGTDSGRDTLTVSLNPSKVSDASGDWTVFLNDGADHPLPFPVDLNTGELKDYNLKVIPSPYAPADPVTTFSPKVGFPTQIDVAETTGFRTGDTVILTDSKDAAITETKKIVAITESTRVITLDTALSFVYSSDSILTRVPRQEIVLDIRSENDYVKVDSLRATAMVKRAYRADGILDGNGNDVRDTSGSGNGGSASRTAGVGDTVKFPLTIENEGNIKDTFTLSQASSCTDTEGHPMPLPPRWDIRVSDGTTDHDITSFSWTTATVPAKIDAGSVVSYTLKVIPMGSPSTCDTVLSITSSGAGTAQDSVKARTVLTATSKVDLWIDGTGDNVYGAAGSGGGGHSSLNILRNPTESFTIGVQNEGNVEDRYTLSLASPPSGWSAVLSETLSGGTEATCTLPCTIPTATAGNPSAYQPGEVPFFNLKVTPPSGFSGSQSLIVDGVSQNDGTKADSVQATVMVTSVDTIAPDSVTLTPGTVESTSVTLTWTAPGDDGNTGQAASYDLRYSTTNFDNDVDDKKFYSAAQVTGLSAPKAAGGSESFTVTRLFANTNYYFALKTADKAGNVSLVSSCPACPVHTTASTDDIPPGTIDDLEIAQATADSVTLCWTAPGDSGFFDNFSDGTLSPWSQLQNGVVALVNDPSDGRVLRKSANGDPNGGWAPINQVEGDFDLVLFTKRRTTSPSNLNRYGVTDAKGNGYGVFLDFTDGKLHMERRDTWIMTEIGTGSSISGGLALNQWYTLRLHRAGNLLSVDAYTGKVDPSTSAPVATVTASPDNRWGVFTQVSVNGGYDYDTDDVRIVSTYSSPGGVPVTGYLVKYSTKSIVDDGVTPGMGEIPFSSAVSAEGVGLPKSPGSRECYTVKVQNIVSGNDRTPDTQFFFAVKAEDENHNKGGLSLSKGSTSTVVPGMTALSPMVYNLVSIPKVPPDSPDPDPKKPRLNSPDAVFGDDVGKIPQLYLYHWHSTGVGHDNGCYDGLPNSYDPNNPKRTNNPPCVQISSIPIRQAGEGYLLWSPRMDIVIDTPVDSTDTPAASCTDENGLPFSCYVLRLDDGWNMIANPFGKESDMSGVKVREADGSQVTTVTFQDAATVRNWIGNAIYTYNGTMYTYDVCDGTGCATALQPWKGYWVWLHRQGASSSTATYELLIPRP